MALPSRGHLSKGHRAGGRQDGAGDEGRALRAPHGLGGHFCNYKESSHLHGPAPAPRESAIAPLGAPTHHAPTGVREQPRRVRPEPRLMTWPGLHRAGTGDPVRTTRQPHPVSKTVLRGGVPRVLPQVHCAECRAGGKSPISQL